MRLTTKGRYAVMAMSDIAFANYSRPISLHEIATSSKIKLNYLEQIFLKLKKANLVNSVKGPGGGYYIAKNLEEIRIIDIINAVSEPIKMTRCDHSNGGCISKNKKCLTHDLWNGLSNQIFQYLSGISLRDICNQSHEKIIHG